MLIEALRPLLVRLPETDLKLVPGVPVELPEEQASRLLAKVPDKVRRVEPLPPGFNQIVQWESADGMVRRGVVDFLHTDADGSVWAFCTWPDGVWCAVNTKHCTKSEPA